LIGLAKRQSRCPQRYVQRYRKLRYEDF